MHFFHLSKTLTTRRYALLLMLTISSFTLATNLYAQKGEYETGAIVVPGQDGKDSVIANVQILIESNKQKRQEAVTYQDKEGQTHTLTPEQARCYTYYKTRYYSININDGNNEKRIFANRKYTQSEDSLSIYQVYSTNKLYEYYMSTNGGTALAVSKDGKTFEGNPLSKYFIAKNQLKGGNEEIAKYVSKTNPDRGSIRDAEKLISSQNTNRIPRVVWGAGVGLNINSVTAYLPEFDAKGASGCQPTAFIFVDSRLFSGFGFHAELGFNRASVKGRVVTNGTELSTLDVFDIDYKRASITLPLMVRNTFMVKGKFLPFYELGVQFEFNIQEKCINDQTHEYISTTSGQYPEIAQSYSSYEGSPSKISAAYILGAGLEYRMTKKHSLFFDIRYGATMAKRNKDGYNLRLKTLSINASVNL